MSSAGVDRPYLLKKGSPAAPWRSGAPAKGLDSWCQQHSVCPNSGASLRPKALVQAMARTVEWQNRAPHTIPHVLFGDTVTGDNRTLQERVEFDRQERRRMVAAAQRLEEQRLRAMANQDALGPALARSRIRNAEKVLDEKYLLPKRERMYPYSGTDPNLKVRFTLEKSHKEQGHSCEFLGGARGQQQVMRNSRRMFQKNRGCQYEHCDCDDCKVLRVPILKRY